MDETARTIAKVTVGSHLHRLTTPTSDIDTREIIVSPLRHLLSPYRNQRPKQTDAPDGDYSRYELNHFLLLASQGNPTMLETLWSDIIQEQDFYWKRLQENRGKLLDTKRVYDAHRGYSFNQRRRMLAVEGFDAHDPVRRGKFCAATIRTLVQGHDLVVYDTFNPASNYRTDFFNYPDVLMYAKQGITVGEMNDVYMPIIEAWEGRLTAAFDARQNRTKADVAWIEEFILDTYTYHSGYRGWHEE